jgi:hypothetical protein
MVYGVYTMERKQIYLPKEQEEALDYLAERRGVSVSHMIREAIAQYLVEVDETPILERVEDHPLWRIVGIIDSPDMPEDASINHDHYLYGAPKVKD